MKHPKRANNKKGFTLVELSIVLVIIGLLIGGILVAESLIGTTKTQTFISQIQQYDVATNTFFDKFGALPGDAARMTGATPGDSDGYIEAAAYTTLVNSEEISNFWPHLSLTGLSKVGGGNFAATMASGIQLDTNAPRAKVGTNVGIIGFGSAAAGGNFYFAGNCSAMTNGTVNCTDGVLDQDAVGVDTKIDDGVGTTGDVLGFDGAISNLSTGLAAAGADAYALGTDTNQSSLTFRIGSRVGDRK